MNRRPAFQLMCLFLLLIFASAVAAAAQEHHPQPAQAEPQQAEKKPEAREHQATKPGEQLAEASREAAGEEPDEFRQSASVRWLAGITGLRPVVAYWVFVVINFLIIAGLIGLLIKSKIPGFFRARNQSIRQQIDEARKASEEARARLTEIEARLARMDSEIGRMQADAEADWRREQERIRADAEQDRQRIVSTAEQEIAAAERLAEHQLRAYAAELAVSLAEKRIRVEPSTDRALLRSFAEQFGKDGGR